MAKMVNPPRPVGHPCLEKVLYLGKPQDSPLERLRQRTFRSQEGISREWLSFEMLSVDRHSNQI
jgi:hypothetical protein